MYDSLFKLQPQHAREAAYILADAFMEDPFFSYLFPDVNHRKKALPVIYKSIVEMNIKSGTAFASSKNMEGVLLFKRYQEQKSSKSLPGSFFIRTLIRMIRLSRHIPVLGVMRRTRR